MRSYLLFFPTLASVAGCQFSNFLIRKTIMFLTDIVASYLELIKVYLKLYKLYYQLISKHLLTEKSRLNNHFHGNKCQVKYQKNFYCVLLWFYRLLPRVKVKALHPISFNCSFSKAFIKTLQIRLWLMVSPLQTQC